MDYKCQTVNISQLNVTHVGFFIPLCETCKTMDCTNAIEKMKISILGVIKEIKTFNKGTEPRFVVQCEGYGN